MDETKLKEFNVELQALLLKYNVNLQVNHGIQVVPKEVEEVVAEKTSDTKEE